MNHRNMGKICISVLIAVMIVGMPVYMMADNVLGIKGEYDIIPPILEPIFPIEFNEPPVSIMNYPSMIHMTEWTEFNLENAINLNEYFYDVEGAQLDYTYECPAGVASVVIERQYLRQVTSFGSPGDHVLRVIASDEFSSVSYDFILRIESRITINMEEDITDYHEINGLLSYRDEYSINSTGEIYPRLNVAYPDFATLEISTMEDWYGTGIITLQTYETPYQIPMPPPIQPMQLALDVWNDSEPGFRFGLFEFDVKVLGVNDMPITVSEYYYQIEITENTAGTLQTPIRLDSLFYDVDSELSYSWRSHYGLTSIGIYDSWLTEVESGEVPGTDVLTIIAFDGEYATTYDILTTVVPRTTLDMTEDIGMTMPLNDIVGMDAQNFYLLGSENVTMEVPEIYVGPPIAMLNSTQDWSGNDVVSVQTEPIINSINPPWDDNTVQSAPIDTIIPIPDIALYGIYEFDVDVAPVNDPPFVISVPSVIMSEDEIVSDAFSVMDCFGDIDSELTYSISEPLTDRISAELEYGGSVRLVPQKNWFGTGVVTLIASDGEFTVSQNVTVTVTSVNDVPYATDAGEIIETDEDNAITVCLADYIADVDDALWYSFSTNNMNATMELDENTWNLTIVPNDDWNGMISMVVYGADAEGQTARNLTLDVAPVNDPPEIQSTGNLIMNEGAVLEIDLSTYITDIDSELEFYLFSYRNRLLCENYMGSMWSLDSTNGNWNGDETIRIIAYDGQYMTQLNLTVKVVPVNNPPMVNSEIYSIDMNEDSEFKLAIGNLFQDGDGDVMEYVIESEGNQYVELNSETMTLKITPEEDWHGTTSLTIHAGDGMVWTSVRIPVTVHPVNDEPYQADPIPPVILNSGNTTVVVLNNYFADIDTSVLDFEIVGTENVTVTPMDSNGFFQLTFAEEWSGTENLLVRVSDGENVLESSMTVSVQIPQIIEEAKTSGSNLLASMGWMGAGIIIALAAFVMYSATKDKKQYAHTTAGKGRVL